MLKVPELQPNQEPFNPNTQYQTHPSLKNGNHSFSFSKAQPDSAIHFDLPNPSPAKLSPQEEENDVLSQALDHTLVKEAITSLHLEDDGETEKLRAYSQAQICDIVPDYGKFIAAQKDKYANLLKNNNQRHFFAQATQPFFAQASARAYAIRNARIRQFQKETIEKQNGELLSRALREENILNDHLQTQYRDMILHNLELLAADVSPSEREASLDTASKDMYTKIMDRRLAIDPRSIGAMLASSAVRRVFSEEELGVYEGAVKVALDNGRFSELALGWVGDGVGLAEARERARGVSSDVDVQKRVIGFYEHFRYTANRKRYLRAILDADNAWRVLKEADYNLAAIPDWVRNGNPGLFAFITEALRRREESGGLFPDPDYLVLCRFVGGFCPYEAAEYLAEEGNVYGLMGELGGVDSLVFQGVLRLILGRFTRGDRNWFGAIERARGEFVGYFDEVPSEGRTGEFLLMFDAVRRLKLEREGREELDPLEVGELIDRCLDAYREA